MSEKHEVSFSKYLAGGSDQCYDIENGTTNIYVTDTGEEFIIVVTKEGKTVYRGTLKCIE